MLAAWSSKAVLYLLLLTCSCSALTLDLPPNTNESLQLFNSNGSETQAQPKLDPRKYRIPMSNLILDFVWFGKQDIPAQCLNDALRHVIVSYDPNMRIPRGIWVYGRDTTRGRCEIVVHEDLLTKEPLPVNYGLVVDVLRGIKDFAGDYRNDCWTASYMLEQIQPGTTKTLFRASGLIRML